MSRDAIVPPQSHSGELPNNTKSLFRIAFRRPKSAFNTQKARLGKKKKSSHLVKRLKVFLNVQKA
jgi:hypothetical protein